MATSIASLRVGSGISTRRSGRSALDESLTNALEPLGGGAPDLVLLFVAPQHEDELAAIVSLANEGSGDAVVLGCVAGGIIGPSREVEDAPAVAAWAARLPGTSVRPFRATFGEDGEQGYFDGFDEFPPRARKAVMVMLADPFTFPAHLLLDHLNERAAGMPVIGGMASGALAAGRTRLIFGDEIHRDGAVGAVLEGGVELRSVVSQGCRPVGETFAVTRSERNVVYELGGMSALSRIEELYAAADERDRLLIRRGLHVGQATTETKPELRQGDFVIRNLVGVDQATGAIAISDVVEVGQTLQFQVRDAESARADLRAMLERERREAGAGVAGALLFSCNGRGQALFGQPDHDVGAVRSAFGDVPVAGFFAAGELGPVGQRNFVHGFTASLLLVRDRENEARSAV